MLDSDQVAAKIAEIKTRREAVQQAALLPGMRHFQEACIASAEDVPALLRLAGAVLKLAEPPAEIDLDIDGYPEGGVTYYVTCDRLREVISRELLGQEAVQ